MSMTFTKKATSGDGKDFEMPPAGSHPAILVGLVDLGTFEDNYNGKKGEKHKVFLVWELTAESDSEGRNFAVGRDFTFSLGAKAHLRPIVEGFRGRAMVEGEEFDFGSLLGQPCMVNLSEGVSSKGKKFIEVASVSKPPKGLTVPPTTFEHFIFDWSAVGSTKDFDELTIPDWMPRIFGRTLLDELKSSKEYGSLSPF